ncbi:MAG TPA: hypothetical protein VMG08_05695 [Allosphingosinicella sp.]|nr:hypothetical protein [Allosphingosinicella sp.]
MRRPRARNPFLLLLLAATPAGAQQVVTSAAPDAVAVTVYREPNRDPDDRPDLEWLGGYALITETRRISLPAGEADIRFEGVAGGILPQSAIVRGLPHGLVERNRDAYLLSPESLLDRSLGRRVHLRRTSRATGAVTEQEAVVRSGADGAVVLQTGDGFEALRCTGLPEMPVYESVPAGLSARPTLSVRARSTEPVTATVTLAYLANGFDWQANYVANLSADGSHVDLFAWVTLANGDETSFANASTQAVAGRINREEVELEAPEAAPLTLTCWPAGRTHELPVEQQNVVAGSPMLRLGGLADSSDLLNALPASEAESIVVTAQRAVQEDLGDLKLYRIPEPVTVAARSQKQVAFLQQPNVQVSFVYRTRENPFNTTEPREASRYLITRNRTQEGLGIPLPAGGIQLFTEGEGRPILVGEGAVRDGAVGEDVEIRLGEAPGVRAGIQRDGDADEDDHYILSVTNDRPVPIRYEMEFQPIDGDQIRPRGARLARRNGKPLWAVTVPANGRAELRYRVVGRDGD